MFVVVWLNMALQPCAMAFGDAKEHGCQHCPPAKSSEASSHSAHEDSAHEAQHSDHSSSPCETSAAQCAFLDDFNYDSRTIQVKVKDSPSDVLVGIAPSIGVTSFNLYSPPLSCVGGNSYLPEYPQALNILYCVYVI